MQLGILTLALAALTAISSPDGRLNVTLSASADNSLHYSVTYDGAAMVAPSQLGLVTSDTDYTKLLFQSVETSQVAVDYELDRIKTSHVQHSATRSLMHFQTPSGRPLDIEWMVSANDVAFRYSIPKDGEQGSVRVMSERTFFDFPDGTTTWLCPQSDAMAGWKRTKPSYEEYYNPGAPLNAASEFGHGFTFPCLFKVGDDGWVLVSETGVDSRYCGSRLSDYQTGAGFQIAFPMPEENNGNGTSEPAFALPGSTPWRTITVGRDLAPIAETTVAFDVVSPRYESSHKYEFGKGSWSWILWQDYSINPTDLRSYVDLSAAMGWKYSLVDNFWDVSVGRDGIEELAEYARGKGVGLFLWYSSSGWWNDVVQSPVNVMSDPIARKKEMRWLQSIGIKGIKVDFFGGDKQEAMALYESILSDADDYGLMVIFHGCTIPRGWERMYPNYVGSEAVRASENLVFLQSECDREALQATLHPFIRNSLGCMEFGGTFLNKYLDRNNGRPDSDGVVWGSVRRTTDAFELATAVLFQNPIQNFALAPNNLTDAPALALDFLRIVPTTWDEIKYIGGEPGVSAVIARRHGDTWYVGAINASDTELSLDVKAVASALGGPAEVLCTVDGELQSLTKFRKPLRIPGNDGAVMIVRLPDAALKTGTEVQSKLNGNKACAGFGFSVQNP